MSDERERLHAGFAQFVAAAAELERSYAELKTRASAIDHALQQTNHALQQALQEREAVFAALPIGLLARRGDGAVGFCNPEAERLLQAAAIAGRSLQAAADGDLRCGELLVRVRRVQLPDGELLLLEDRSRVHELERTVHRLDRLAGLSELALGIAHEIKNPLNGVMGFAALLERSQDAAAMRRYAGKVVAGVRQVDGIVKALLGFARPERQDCRMAAVGDVIGEAAQVACLPAHRVRVSGPREPRVDADALVRVLANLFGNAVEAAPDVGIDVRIGVRAQRLELVVQDDGPGIQAMVGHRVFEPFVSTKERGTGLGLPLCVRVLSFLGGRLELLNPGEPGARFRIELPLAEVAGTTAIAAASPAAQAAEAGR